jgi:hypothetical protein
MSTGVDGGPPSGRDVQRQWARNAVRCQSSSVTGFTIFRASEPGSQAAEPYKQQSIYVPEGHALWGFVPQNIEFMPKDKDFQLSSAARDRTNPIKAQQINLQRSLIDRTIDRFVSQLLRACGRDNTPYDYRPDQIWLGSAPLITVIRKTGVYPCWSCTNCGCLRLAVNALQAVRTNTNCNHS